MRNDPLTCAALKWQQTQDKAAGEYIVHRLTPLVKKFCRIPANHRHKSLSNTDAADLTQYVWMELFRLTLSRYDAEKSSYLNYAFERTPHLVEEYWRSGGYLFRQSRRYKGGSPSISSLDSP